MIPTITKKSNELILSTGNILSNELGRNPCEELREGIKTTLSSSSSSRGANGGDDRTNDSEQGTKLNDNLSENGRSEINIAVKIFLNKNSSAYIKSAVEAALSVLDVKYVDSVVLAYHPNAVANATPTTPTPKTPCSEGPATTVPPSFQNSWSERNGDEALDELYLLYQGLEKYAQEKQISALGLSDLDAIALERVYKIAKVAPSIAQINLASCCVVPPELKDFCNNHDIQLLTHADPELLLPEEEFKNLVPDYTPNWILRYQVHLRCRGVLTSKGYIIGASTTSATP